MADPGPTPNRRTDSARTRATLVTATRFGAGSSEGGPSGPKACGVRKCRWPGRHCRQRLAGGPSQGACAARKLRRPRRIAPTTSRWPLGGIEQWRGDYPRFEARLESRLSCPLVLRPSMPWPGQALVGTAQAEPLGQGTISGEQALAKSASSPRPVPARGNDRVFAPHMRNAAALPDTATRCPLRTSPRSRADVPPRCQDRRAPPARCSHEFIDRRVLLVKGERGINEDVDVVLSVLEETPQPGHASGSLKRFLRQQPRTASSYAP